MGLFCKNMFLQKITGMTKPITSTSFKAYFCDIVAEKWKRFVDAPKVIGSYYPYDD